MITEDDLEVSVEENRNSCYGKILFETELNIQNIRRCLCRAWRGNDFRVCKIGKGLYQFFFKKKNAIEFILANGPYQFFFQKKDVVEFILANGPWSVDEHLLILTPRSDNFLGKAIAFVKTFVWIQVTGLLAEWYSLLINKRLFSYLKDSHFV